MVDHEAKMLELQATDQNRRVNPTPESIASFEHRFELTLPEDYRAFLERHASKSVQAAVTFREPTPLGEEAPLHEFFGFSTNPKATDLAWATNVAEGRGLCIPIGANYLGHWYFLMCKRGRQDFGSVCLRDHQRRHTWSDETFTARFPKLSPSIERYITLRRSDSLPPVLSRTPGWYLVGSTFDDFLASCRKHHQT